MPASAWLALAILSEVIATSLLKATDGFSRPVLTAIVAFGYAMAFYSLSIVLKDIPVGIAYAIWSGAGIVLVTGMAWISYGQRIDSVQALGICLIVIGVVICRLRG